MQCKQCLHEFIRGASRIRDHCVHSTPACGVSHYEKVLENMLALMQQEHAKRVEKEHESAAKRALEMVTCSTGAVAVAAGSSKKQKMAQPWVVLSEEEEEEEEEEGSVQLWGGLQ